LRGSSKGEAEQLLKIFGIYERCNDEVRTYSSGMKQRLSTPPLCSIIPEILVLMSLRKP